MKVRLLPYKSTVFPVLAMYRKGSHMNTQVFETEQKAVDYMKGRFGNVEIISQLPKAETEE